MIKPKKSLGQNFLIDKKIIDTIIDIIEIRDKFILEVGPGTGNLTSSILKKKPKKLILVEKDESLITLLKDKFHSKVITINKDILKIDENLIEDKKLIVFGLLASLCSLVREYGLLLTASVYINVLYGIFNWNFERSNLLKFFSLN